jgi:predicted ester cyclase
VDEAERTVRGLVERVWNEGRLDELDRYVASSFDHGGRPDDLAGLRSWHAADALTWADQRYEIVELVSDGTHVALRWRATARHVGAWGPVPPTGRIVTADGVHFCTVRDGLVVALWAMSDRFGKAQQLGVTMTPPA